MKLVKVARVGEKVKEVALNDDGTIEQVLRGANIYPLPHEDVWVGHSIETNLKAMPPTGMVIIVEPKKAANPCGCSACQEDKYQSTGRERFVISTQKKALMDFLEDNNCFDFDRDEEGEKDYQETYRNEKEFIEELIKLAKAV